MSPKLSHEELILLRDDGPDLVDIETRENRTIFSSSRRRRHDASAAACAGVVPGRGESPLHLGGGLVRLRGLLAYHSRVSDDILVPADSSVSTRLAGGKLSSVSES